MICDSKTEARQAVNNILSSSLSDRQRILLVPQSSDVTIWRQFFAENQPHLAFGTEVTTLYFHVIDQWSLFGDGSEIVTNQQRLLIMLRALCDVHEGEDSDTYLNQLPLSLTTAQSLAQAVQEGARYPHFWDELDKARKETRQADFAVLSLYREYLSQSNLIEYGDALSALSSANLPQASIVAYDVRNPMPLEQKYLEQRAAVHIDYTPAGDSNLHGIPLLLTQLYNPQQELPALDQVRFASAAGVTAEPRLIANLVQEFVGKGFNAEDIAVVSPRPDEIFQKVSPFLEEMNIGARGSISKSLATTQIGAAFFSLLQLVLNQDQQMPASFGQKAHASTFLMGPYSSLSAASANNVDVQMRGDARITVAEILKLIQEKVPESAEVIASIAAGDYVTALSLLGAMNTGPTHSVHPQAMLNNAALTKGLETLNTAQDMNLDSRWARGLLEQLNVTVHTARGPDRGGFVRFLSLSHLAQQGARVAIIAQMSSHNYTLDTIGDPVRGLLARLNVSRKDTRAEDMRLTFARALAAIEDTVILERPLTTVEGKPDQPATLFEEVVDCFIKDLTSDEDIDNNYLIPKKYVDYEGEGKKLHATLGEEKFCELLPRSYAERDSGQQKLTPAGSSALQGEEVLSPEVASHFALKGKDELVFSASNVELYLRCPYRWFVQRGVNPESLDRESGPLEFGNLMHATMEQFYRTFQERGHKRVTDENLPEALTLIDEVFDELVFNPPQKDRDFPVVSTQIEIQHAETQRRRLHDMMATEPDFLPSYQPAYYELKFGQEDQPTFMYAGHKFKGIIDRIDIYKREDDMSVAAVIDYKGSIDATYNVKQGETMEFLTPRIQTFIYAAAAEHLLQTEVVGALYRSYKDGKVEGAANPIYISASSLSKRNLGVITSEEVWVAVREHVESVVVEGIERMLSGDIARRPLTPDSCKYCPVMDCSKRLAD